jgi:MFS family permease
MAAPHTLHALTTVPSFMRFWWARMTGTAAAQMLMVALGWQIYDVTGSAWDLGLVGLLQFVPALLLTLPAGHAVDRFDRRRILALCLGLQAALAVLLALAAFGDWTSRGLIFAVSVLLGVGRAFQMPAQQAMLPQLVPAAVLPRALALSSAATQAAIIGGPTLGGFVYVAGAAVVYGLCGTLFLTGCALVLGIAWRPLLPQHEPATLTRMLAGFTFIWRRKPVLGAVSLDLFAVLLGGATALLPIFAKDILHTGPWGLGLLRSAPAVGALLVSASLARWPIERRAGRWLFMGVAVYGLATITFALSTVFALSFAALVVTGGADMVSVVIRQSLVQLETPDAMRGRVSAVNSIFIGASNQLGEFESGATAALLGAVGSVLLGGIGTLLVVALWMRWFRELLGRDRLPPD